MGLFADAGAVYGKDDLWAGLDRACKPSVRLYHGDSDGARYREKPNQQNNLKNEKAATRPLS